MLEDKKWNGPGFGPGTFRMVEESFYHYTTSLCRKFAKKIKTSNYSFTKIPLEGNTNQEIKINVACFCDLRPMHYKTKRFWGSADFIKVEALKPTTSSHLRKPQNSFLSPQINCC